MPLYDAAFFARQSADSRRSASVALPRVMELVKPRSVLDIGCGVGTWLAEFAALGVSDYLGVDGNYVPHEQLQIPADRFRAADLTKPLDLGRRFDLATSLEVGEHLPQASAETCVASLTSAAPVVLFSAAIPGQGGDGHINEQWQDYWRGLFHKHGYAAVDAIRPQIWGRDDVAWWYQQNIVLYVIVGALDARFTPYPSDRSLNMVHPDFLKLEPGLKQTLARIPALVGKSISRRLRHYQPPHAR